MPTRRWPRPGYPGLAEVVAAVGVLLYTAAVYLVVVVGADRLAGGAGASRPVLAVLAAAIVALTLQPVHRRLRARLPARTQDRLAGLTAGDPDRHDLGARLDQLVRLLALSFGTSARAVVTATLGDGLTATWAWPAADPAPAADREVVRRPIRRGERELGKVRVERDAGPGTTPVEHQLLTDAAAHAALVIDGARMDRTLRRLLAAADDRHAELERSRSRVLAAMEGERRRLERDIHDGAQQHLVALVVNLRLLRVLLTKDPVRASATAARVRLAVDDAIESLDRLSRGLYPTVLAEQGPEAALRSAVRASPVPVVLHTELSRRWPAAVEQAAYFSCLEALQNAVKHAQAQRIVVSLVEAEDRLTFAVTDDGHGFDPSATPSGSGTVNLEDRLSGAGGQLSVVSAPDRGTTVSGWIPLSPVAVAA